MRDMVSGGSWTESFSGLRWTWLSSVCGSAGRDGQVRGGGCARRASCAHSAPNLRASRARESAGLIASRSRSSPRAACNVAVRILCASTSRPEARMRAGGASVTSVSSRSWPRASSTSSVGPGPMVACAAGCPSPIRISACASSSTACRTRASPTPAAISTPSTSMPRTSTISAPVNALARAALSDRSSPRYAGLRRQERPGRIRITQAG